MGDRYEQLATVIISQLPTEQWYESIDDTTIADASPIGLYTSATE
jgi:hypothetical protein